jgi:hypothetical protein
VRRLQLEEHERDAVDEADDVAATGVQRTDDPELVHREELVVRGRAPVDEANGLGLAIPSVVGDRDLRAVTQQLPDRLVGAGRVHRRAIEASMPAAGTSGFSLGSFGRSRWWSTT